MEMTQGRGLIGLGGNYYTATNRNWGYNGCGKLTTSTRNHRLKKRQTLSFVVVTTESQGDELATSRLEGAKRKGNFFSVG